jgi:hypothetical protein
MACRRALDIYRRSLAIYYCTTHHEFWIQILTQIHTRESECDEVPTGVITI